MSSLFLLRPAFVWRLIAACTLGLAAAAAGADELRVGSTTRTYSAIVPPFAQNAPLVLVLHGNTQQGHDMRERTSWPAVAARHGFVVVFPDGLERAWADLRTPEERLGRSPPPGTDDEAFLLALVRHYVERGIADRRRVYVTGVSNGGAMAMTLACRHTPTFAAAAAVVMALTPASAQACQPAGHVPMLLMNGTADPLIPFDGGASRSGRGGSYLSTAQTIAFWRRANECAAEDAAHETLPETDRADHSTVTRIASRCPPDTDVLLYRVDGGGHRLPDIAPDAKRPKIVDAMLGHQNHDIAGPEAIWQFLARFSRP